MYVCMSMYVLISEMRLISNDIPRIYRKCTLFHIENGSVNVSGKDFSA